MCLADTGAGWCRLDELCPPAQAFSTVRWLTLAAPCPYGRNSQCHVGGSRHRCDIVVDSSAAAVSAAVPHTDGARRTRVACA
jgi:hypothetical protein